MATRGGSAGSGPSLWLWLGLAVIVILADQVTKTLIVGWFQLGDVRAVTSNFNLVRAHNAGAAFSFLAGASGWQRWFFTALGLVVSGFIVWMIRQHPTQKLFCFAVSMIMGGALGNVIDRLIHGYVVDFLQFRFSVLEPIFPGGYFPSFNIADSAITLGAICLILDEILRVKRAR
jgi:signal peptidase II